MTDEEILEAPSADPSDFVRSCEFHPESGDCASTSREWEEEAYWDSLMEQSVDLGTEDESTDCDVFETFFLW